MYSVEHKIIATLLSLLLLLQARLIRDLVGTYIFPAAIFSLVWSFYLLVPLVVLFDAPINSVAVVYICICILLFSVSAICFDWKKAFLLNRIRSNSNPILLDTLLIRRCLYMATILSILFSSLSMMINGFDWRVMIFNFIETSGQYASLRGHEELEYGLVGVLSIFFTYLAPALGGLLYVNSWQDKKRSWWVLWALMPAVYYMLTQSTKLTLLVAIATFLATVMLAKIYRNQLSIIRLSKIISVSMYGLLLLPLVAISFLTREGYSNYADIYEAIGLLRYAAGSYVLGQIYAFSDFFSDYLGMDSYQSYKDDSYSMGYYTFKSIFDTFGGTKVFPPGYYDESFPLGDVLETNLFTVFRSLIQDFGIVGSAVFMFCFGLTVHGVYFRLLTAKRPWAHGAIIVAFFVFVIVSYLFSIFTARYMFLVCLALYFILVANENRTLWWWCRFSSALRNRSAHVGK